MVLTQSTEDELFGFFYDSVQGLLQHKMIRGDGDNTQCGSLPEILVIALSNGHVKLAKAILNATQSVLLAGGSPGLKDRCASFGPAGI